MFMKRCILALMLIFLTIPGFAQSIAKFSATQLKSDLAYLKQQLYTVHIDPYTEFNRGQYDQLFGQIETKLQDSLTATDFLKLIKPAIARLCDEHAQAFLPEKLLSDAYRQEAIYLPFTLTQKNDVYRVGKILSAQSDLKTGAVITEIDHIPVATLINQSALFTSGYPGQRLEKALEQFGYLYTWSQAEAKHNHTVKVGDKTVEVPGVTLKVWQEEQNRQTGWDSACDEKISYQKFGDVGYLNACSFSIPQKQIDSIHKKIDLVFEQIEKDNPKYLLIDVSKNSGGQSVVGRMIIDDFYDKPYRGFGSNFKRSQAYIDLLKSWKIEADDYYKAAPEGKVFHFPPDTTFPQPKPRYKGKVILLVGNGTFSSAMMMATWIKDNHIATIAGETPVNGHPNGFGELYQTKLPNTRINILFGVKQWIRPSGDLKDNLLKPDVEVKLTDDKQELIKRVLEAVR